MGEIPFSYISESDRYLAFSDLLFPALMPGAATTHQGLVRLEDVDPTANPTVLRQFADYLFSQHVPFSVAVIPQYTDPKGTYNGGRPQMVTLAQAPAVVSALKYMQSKGGTIIEHGNTHQYSNVANPYNGVTGDDCRVLPGPVLHDADSPVPVPLTLPEHRLGHLDRPAARRLEARGRPAAPRPGGSCSPRRAWPRRRSGKPRTTSRRRPTMPASNSVYATRYERELFVSGQLNGGPLDYSRIVGQFFPYVVNDVYGEKIIPEDLGNYEPTTEKQQPAQDARWTSSTTPR